MDIQDLQDNSRSDLQHGEIPEKIIGCAFEVFKELGTGFLESVYEKALTVALRAFCRDHPVHPVYPCSFVLFQNTSAVRNYAAWL